MVGLVLARWRNEEGRGREGEGKEEEVFAGFLINVVVIFKGKP